jgi:hypothetical protein
LGSIRFARLYGIDVTIPEGHLFLQGKLLIPLSNIGLFLNKETWFTLQTNEQNDAVSGDVLLKFVMQSSNSSNRGSTNLI